jgi:antitoxin MazE
MHTKIQKWGNSLGLRIPRSYAEEAQVEEGSTVDVSVENGCLRIRPLRARKYLLSDLLKRISRKNLHPEIVAGDAVGREAW